MKKAFSSDFTVPMRATAMTFSPAPRLLRATYFIESFHYLRLSTIAILRFNLLRLTLSIGSTRRLCGYIVKPSWTTIWQLIVIVILTLPTSIVLMLCYECNY